METILLKLTLRSDPAHFTSGPGEVRLIREVPLDSLLAFCRPGDVLQLHGDLPGLKVSERTLVGDCRPDANWRLELSFCHHLGRGMEPRESETLRGFLHTGWKVVES